jgi:ribosomal protein L37AE/L43A
MRGNQGAPDAVAVLCATCTASIRVTVAAAARGVWACPACGARTTIAPHLPAATLRALAQADRPQAVFSESYHVPGP